MSKTIRVDDSVHAEIEKMRDWKQTMSDVIRDLVLTRRDLCELLDVIEGQIRYREWQRERQESQAQAYERADRTPVS